LVPKDGESEQSAPEESLPSINVYNDPILIESSDEENDNNSSVCEQLDSLLTHGFVMDNSQWNNTVFAKKKSNIDDLECVHLSAINESDLIQLNQEEVDSDETFVDFNQIVTDSLEDKTPSSNSDLDANEKLIRALLWSSADSVTEPTRSKKDRKHNNRFALDSSVSTDELVNPNDAFACTSNSESLKSNNKPPFDNSEKNSSFSADNDKNKLTNTNKLRTFNGRFTLDSSVSIDTDESDLSDLLNNKEVVDTKEQSSLFQSLTAADDDLDLLYFTKRFTNAKRPKKRRFKRRRRTFIQSSSSEN
jgi:hypothetical protein